MQNFKKGMYARRVEVGGGPVVVQVAIYTYSVVVHRYVHSIGLGQCMGCSSMVYIGGVIL